MNGECVRRHGFFAPHKAFLEKQDFVIGVENNVLCFLLALVVRLLACKQANDKIQN